MLERLARCYGLGDCQRSRTVNGTMEIDWYHCCRTGDAGPFQQLSPRNQVSHFFSATFNDDILAGWCLANADRRARVEPLGQRQSICSERANSATNGRWRDRKYRQAERVL